MAAQTDNTALAARFTTVAQALQKAEATITSDLVKGQGVSMDIGGYYAPDSDKATAAMRPSATFNQIIASV